MKSMYILSVVLAFATAARYNTKYDDYNLQADADDVNSLKKYYECFVDLGPCEDVAATFKVDIADAIENACNACTDKQKHHMKVFATAMKSKLPDEFTIFLKKYDPENKYFEKLAAAIKDY